MMRSLTIRRLVTGISVFMLLLCQTMAAAMAYTGAPVTVPVQTAATDTDASCHHAQDTDNSPPAHGCQDRCPSRDASFETAKINLPAVDTLALPVFIIAAAAPVTAVTMRRGQILASATAPPLILVYGRLLI
jgi:hypothetical protein